MIWWTVAKDEEREFRFRPRKPPARNDRAAWASAYKILMHHARMSGSRKRPSVGLGSGRNALGLNQRCAVRVMYAKNTVAGQWRAHGLLNVASADGLVRLSNPTVRR